ncbi:hypothetical protein HPB50_007176 [Hyalomma asiaticum]|uniref:Uncharacterized protein n=1 Tax=Hyalomma asiaticum TaxID=266040 RepID=A0ACB7SBM6_HYAAI|nr:hypothetical protein HPB50_007176 [Hyalomma asiaticum]
MIISSVSVRQVLSFVARVQLEPYWTLSTKDRPERRASAQTRLERTFFSMNTKRRTILVATINAERKRKYADLKLLMFEEGKLRKDYVRRYAGGLRKRRRA